MSKNKKIILTSVLLAMQIILSRFLSIKTPIVKISFAFVPTMLCATWLGPKWTVLLNVLGDVIGATLFPTGPYFVGYTISTAIAGLIYGLLLYKKKSDSFSDKIFIFRVIIAILLVNLIVNLGLNTLWTSITSGKAFQAILVTRLIKQLIMIPINVAIITFIEKILRKPFDTYIRSNDD
jgi:ECF transporter S component (folate family)